jgi:hypothetical protein
MEIPDKSAIAEPTRVRLKPASTIETGSATREDDANKNDKTGNAMPSRYATPVYRARLGIESGRK